ncbi:methyltransferase domain-containing protein [Peptostreptococcus russellii]|uniref:methyltransferase domain-containing protein n=1 Tax=Peptostreptococcus russellii TaxID=215200 RepID=UPI001626B1F8|nr:methyltransferase domain-containing protein [Peptostreptococcus russellii]MBC2577038.1 methyltransferase domain-containing protein [Peptostreptococcus russellii]
MKNEEIKKNVAEFYKDIAVNRDRVIEDKDSLSKSIGYSEEELENIPKEANLGLGCGSPLKIGEAQSGEIVVDLGCGKGMDVFIASKKVGKNGKVIGIDMTMDMISEARELASKNNYKNVEFRLGEIEHLPIADNTANLVISNCVINLSIDKQGVYNDIYRILKPGGRISISDITLANPLPKEVLENPCMYGS